MKKILLLASLVGGFTVFGTERAEAGHRSCDYGYAIGGYASGGPSQGIRYYSSPSLGYGSYYSPSYGYYDRGGFGYSRFYSRPFLGYYNRGFSLSIGPRYGYGYGGFGYRSYSFGGHHGHGH